MLRISDFFKRIKNKHSQELFVRQTIQSVIKKHTNIEIPTEYISIKSTTLSIANISQTMKSVIFIKKQNLISEINSAQTIKKITDIK